MTTASSFLTTVPEMQAAATKVATVADQIDADMKQLDNLIQPVAGQWQGAAAMAYFQLHQRWMENTAKLQRVLMEISQGITENATRYQTQEDAVQAVMQQTAGALA